MSAPVSFVLRFLAFYLALQGTYIFFLYVYEPGVDPVTRFTAHLLPFFFEQASLSEPEGLGKIQFLISEKAIVNIKEGCNGISVVLVLVSFLMAFRHTAKSVFPLMILAIATILIMNVLRLIVLINIKIHFPSLFVGFHEYIFPVFLYLVAFGFMYYWVKSADKSTHGQ